MRAAPDRNEASGFILKIDGAEMRIATGAGAGLNLFCPLPPGKNPPEEAQLLGYAKGKEIEIAGAGITLTGLCAFWCIPSTDETSPFIFYREESSTDGRPANEFITLVYRDRF